MQEGDGSLDLQLLSAAITDRGSYESVAPYLVSSDMSAPVGRLWGVVGSYYSRDSAARRVDLDVLRGLVRDMDGLDKRQLPLLLDTIGRLPNINSPPNVALAALLHLRKQTSLRLAQAIAAGDSVGERAAFDRYSSLMAADSLSDTGRRSKRAASVSEASPVASLFQRYEASARIKLAPDVLNCRLNGGALPGTHIVVFGRPEAGKTAFAVTVAAGAVLRNPDIHVLYAGNEDYIDTIKLRALSYITNLTEEQILEDQEAAAALYVKRGGESRLHLIQLHNARIVDLRPYMDRFAPTVVVLDQIRNVRTESDPGVQSLEEAGQEFRQLLVEYGAVGVSITQAGVDRLYLGLSDMYGSKTGLQGTADVIVGIGVDDANMRKNQRILTFPKQKLARSPSDREPVTVDVDLAHSRYYGGPRCDSGK